jgi:sugar-specific transcriptional regulator TrmB
MIDKLISLGLTKNQAEIYLYLLKKGNSTTGPIIKCTGISNSRVYTALEELIKKGLISYNVQSNGKHFYAESPEKFLDLEQERQKQLEDIIPDLKTMIGKRPDSTSYAVFEGIEGTKTAFKRILEDCPIGATIYVIGFSEQNYGVRSLRTIISKAHKRHVEKKHIVKILLDSKIKGQPIAKEREVEPITEVRYMPKGYTSPAAIDIFEEYVYIFLWGKKPSVFMIKNNEIAESFKHYFKFLWGLAK